MRDGEWRLLMAQHEQLLHKHHDFFHASQHPSARSVLREIPAKRAMTVRLWRHGVHNFLEVLRHRLPESSEHMLAFMHIASL